MVKGEALGTDPQSYDLLLKPTTQSHPDVKEREMAMAAWTKKNSQALGLLQGTILPAIWVDYIEHFSAKIIWDALVMRFRKAGGVHRPTSKWER